MASNQDSFNAWLSMMMGGNAPMDGQQIPYAPMDEQVVTQQEVNEASTGLSEPPPDPAAVNELMNLMNASNKRSQGLLDQMDAAYKQDADVQNKMASEQSEYLNALANMPIQTDLSPIAAMLDSWRGTNTAKSFAPKETPQDRLKSVEAIKSALNRARGNISQSQIDQIKSRLESQMKIDKSSQDAIIQRMKLGAKGSKPNIGPVEKAQITTLGGKVANQASIVNVLGPANAQFKEALRSGNKDLAIKIGQGMIKALNSDQGADAVGVEEAKRLGSLLEFQLLNLTNPGPIVGRDLELFTEQVDETVSKLKTAVKNGQTQLDSLAKGEKLKFTDDAPSLGDVVDGYRFKGGDASDPNNWEPAQ